MTAVFPHLVSCLVGIPLMASARHFWVPPHNVPPHNVVMSAVIIYSVYVGVNYGVRTLIFPRKT